MFALQYLKILMSKNFAKCEEWTEIKRASLKVELSWHPYMTKKQLFNNRSDAILMILF